MANAASGINTKLASSARKTSLPLRRGAKICRMVRLKPTASILETTKASIVIGTALLRRSIQLSLAVLVYFVPSDQATA